MGVSRKSSTHSSIPPEIWTWIVLHGDSCTCKNTKFHTLVCCLGFGKDVPVVVYSGRCHDYSTLFEMIFTREQTISRTLHRSPGLHPRTCNKKNPQIPGNYLLHDCKQQTQHSPILYIISTSRYFIDQTTWHAAACFKQKSNIALKTPRTITDEEKNFFPPKEYRTENKKKQREIDQNWSLSSDLVSCFLPSWNITQTVATPHSFR